MNIIVTISFYEVFFKPYDKALTLHIIYIYIFQYIKVDGSIMEGL